MREAGTGRYACLIRRRMLTPCRDQDRRILLTVRKLIFRDDSLDFVGLDAVSQTSISLDGHALNDGIDLWHIGLHPPLRPLTAVKDFVV
jgi:hypothetical protein